MKKLRHLHLFQTNLTDESIPILEKLIWLETLEISKTMISEDGIKRLKEKLPKTTIYAASPDWHQELPK